MQSILQDLRFAVRRLVKDRWFTVAAIAALALGIGANSAVFTLVNAVLLRGLPFDRPDRIMLIDTKDERGRNFGVSMQDFDDWRRDSRSFSGMAVVAPTSMNISADDRVPEQYTGVYLSAGGFAIIGEKAALGRVFNEEDDRPGAPPVVLVSSSVWKTRYAADPAIIGKAIRVNALPVTVIGVMPEGMKFPYNNDLWMPVSQLPPAVRQQGRGMRTRMVYGRLGDGVTLEQARSELSNRSAQLAQQYQDTNKGITAVVTPYAERIAGPQIKVIFWSLMRARRDRPIRSRWCLSCCC
jgi:putative ABC transport system permease protein